MVFFCSLKFNLAIFILSLREPILEKKVGNSNDGFLMGDYKIKKAAKGVPMRKDSTIKFPKKTGNSEGAL